MGPAQSHYAAMDQEGRVTSLLSERRNEILKSFTHT